MMDLIKVQQGDYSEALARTIEVLNGGGVVVIPTDTAYGLSVRVDREEGLQKILQIKNRVPDKGLSIIVRDIEQAREFADIDQRVEQFFQRLFPGPVTLLLPAKRQTSKLLTGMYPTVALRVPNHPFTLALAASLPYAVTTTSANLSGHDYTPDPNDIISTFSQGSVRPDLFIEEGILPSSVFSTILDLTQTPYQITRVGAVSETDLQQYLGDLV